MQKRATRTGILLAVTISAVITITHGLSGHYAQYNGLLSTQQVLRAQQALRWNRSQPDALLTLARSQIEEDPENARNLLTEAIGTRPVHAKSIVMLSGLDNTEPALADRLIDTAVSFTPSYADILIDAAKHWAKRGDDARVVALWSDALTANPRTREQLFPVLSSVAEDPATRHLLRGITEAGPAWWEDFFEMLAKTALSTESVRRVFAGREKSLTYPPTPRERRAFVERLLEKELVTEAYLVWMEGLSDEEKEHLGLLYNGSFEIEPGNTGFDWVIHSPKSTQAGTVVISFGVNGKRALRVLFQGFDEHYHHIGQRLFLEPGKYRMKGRMRIDNLKTQGGFRWVIRCKLGNAWQELGSSYRIIGMSEWHDFNIDLTVPPVCTQHEIRLMSADYQHADKVTGSLWFDDFRLRRITAR
ncbi:MAG: hypothetical protein BECKG1743D_GA0114223_101503 [Candidatus Kentron sp. G]|nr:MAG: hypothetical protein BECKG1743F_GA0114225_101073 [Candidatus Kentron sp. G]VFM97380.1 MAG: hypothetical protein BECKG1743E_GA0114224_101283 [Candidatus Kentron sp. G]VFM99840.1 MAG: hypothetical protein BECKG1743D_GA0114223_101503 [Candidatus Kentron sp. G]